MTPIHDAIDLTLVVPCYNEESVIERTVPPLLAAIEAVVPRCEIVLVDNGSTDGTRAKIERLCTTSERLVWTRVDVNTGYGRGVLSGYEIARGRVVGHIPADGPVEPEEVARLALQALELGPGHLVSAVRRDRRETLVRRVVSKGYNTLFWLVFGNLSRDINGTPKFMHRTDYRRLQPESTDYFLEAEMMLGATRMGIEVVQSEVRSIARPAGRSKVSARLLRAIAEFLRNMIRYRLATMAPLDAETLLEAEE